MSTTAPLLPSRRLEVLVLADEPLARQIAEALSIVALRVTPTADPAALLARLWERVPDMIVVAETERRNDIPEACRQVRQFFQAPILIIEAGASERDRIGWLDSGADDVVSLATVRSAEFVARCYALIRRFLRQLRRDPACTQLQAFGLRLDIAERRIYRDDGPPVDLGASATRLLALFFSYGDRVVPQEVLTRHLAGTVKSRDTQRALIRSVNRRLEALPGVTPRIEAVYERGYRFTVASDAASSSVSA